MNWSEKEFPYFNSLYQGEAQILDCTNYIYMEVRFQVSKNASRLFVPSTSRRGKYFMYETHFSRYTYLPEVATA